MKTKKAFTLIELLVVVAIIAVLIAILLPALSKARITAQTVACASQPRMFGQVLSMYANDYNDFLPPNGIYEKMDSPDVHAIYNGREQHWTGHGLFYGGNNKHASAKSNEGVYIKDRNLFYCPYNRMYSYNLAYPKSVVDDLWTNPGYNVYSSYDYLGNFCWNDNSGKLPTRRGKITDSPGKMIMTETRYDRFYKYRFHGNKINMLYLGGHVKSLNIDKIMAGTNYSSQYWLIMQTDDPFTEPLE